MKDTSEVWWLKPAVVGAVFLILAVLTCAAVVMHNDKMLDSINSLTGNAVMIVLGYYFGSSSGSAKKDEMLAASVPAPMPPVPPVAPAAPVAPVTPPTAPTPPVAPPVAASLPIVPPSPAYQDGRTSRLSGGARGAPAGMSDQDVADWLRGYDEAVA